MNVSFTSDKLTNSTAVDSATGQPLFEFSTPLGLKVATTLLNANKEVVGQYTPGLIHDEVTYQGRTMKLSEWLVKKSALSRTRTLVAQNGREYKWEYGGMLNGGYELIDCETGRSIAKGHRKHTKLFKPSIPCNIDVTPDGLPIVDTIVFSFVICELIARREEDAVVASTTS